MYCVPTVCQVLSTHRSFNPHKILPLSSPAGDIQQLPKSLRSLGPVLTFKSVTLIQSHTWFSTGNLDMVNSQTFKFFVSFLKLKKKRTAFIYNLLFSIKRLELSSVSPGPPSPPWLTAMWHSLAWMYHSLMSGPFCWTFGLFPQEDT